MYAYSGEVCHNHTAAITRLARVAYDLARKAGPTGITVSDVRMEAYRLNLLTGSERGRYLSFLCAVPPAGGLIRTERTRRSNIRITHGNRQTVWIHPQFDEIQPYSD